MDTLRLFEAIKELRAELDRVQRAIQRIEAIAGGQERPPARGKRATTPKKGS